MSEQEILDAITKLLEESPEPNRDHLEAEYDGIYGTPPKLIPNYYKNDFKRIRDRLLFNRGYSHDALMGWIDRYRVHFLIELADEHVTDFYRQPGRIDPNDFKIMRRYPNGYPLDRLCFMDDEIGLLAWLRWLVFDIDEKTAKEQLKSGRDITGNAKKAVEARHAPLNETKAHCVRLAGGLWKHNPKYKDYTASEMATALLKDLDHPNQSHLQKPARKHSITEWLKDAHKDKDIDLVIPNFPE